MDGQTKGWTMWQQYVQRVNIVGSNNFKYRIYSFPFANVASLAHNMLKMGLPGLYFSVTLSGFLGGLGAGGVVAGDLGLF